MIQIFYKLMNEINDNNEERKTVYKDKELWRVGVICKKDCYELTQDILNILLQKGFEWKIISSSYSIKCKRRITEENKINEKYSEVNPLIVEIKIYGDVDPNNKEEFLVDLHKKSGNVMEFLQFSSSIISSMQQEGLIVFK